MRKISATHSIWTRACALFERGVAMTSAMIGRHDGCTPGTPPALA
jgi:hypothetical protein